MAVAGLSSQVARAHPYASGITNTAGTISFYLNETADTVGVYFPDNNSTNFLGSGLTAGVHSFALGAGTNSYVITVKKAGSGAPNQISSDANNFNKFFGGRCVAVNPHPTTSNFGRIYVGNGSAGTTLSRSVQKGIYVLNADQSDAVGQGNLSRSAGITWGTSSTSYAPYKLSVGPDDYVYIADATTDGAQMYRANADISGTADSLLSGRGLLATPGGATVNGTPNVNHGRVASSPIAYGSLAAGTLQVYDVDIDLPPLLYIQRYDINAGPLPYASAPTTLGNGVLGGFAVYCDLRQAPDGKFFLNEYRANFAANTTLRVFDTDATTELWNDTAAYGGSGTPLIGSYGMAVSPDGKYVGTVLANGNWTFMRLTNGIPDLSTLVTNTLAGGSTARGISFDSAENVYLVSGGSCLLRVFSLGLTTTCITSNDASTVHGSFSLVTPSTTVSTVATVPVTSQDTTQPKGQFTITRTGDTTLALAVPFTLTGTATNGIQYTTLPLTATIPAAQASVNVFVTAIPNAIPGPTRTVIMSVLGAPSYSVVAPSSATVVIVDTNKPAISIALTDTQFYERTNDFARFTLSRLGNTNVDLPAINVTYGGTAVAGTHFYGYASTNMAPGTSTEHVYVYPIHDGVVTGPLTVTASVAAAGDGSYTVGTPATSGAVTRVDSDDPPETVLWSDNFSTDTSASWTNLFAAAPDPTPDYDINVLPASGAGGAMGTWPFDYSALLIPSAPHTTDGSTKGLFLTVNKNDAIAAAAALNLYPIGQSFSGNYALRFDMFLIRNTLSGQTEYALFGINHSGTKTNWFRNSTTTFTGVDAAAWDFDGIFYDVEADGASLGDYASYTSPSTATRNPTPIPAGPATGGGRWASTLEKVFKSPPWTPTAGNGGTAANVSGTTTPIWADVELRQVDGIVSWFINHELIWAYTNTSGYTSGNIMLGYTDAYDSIGDAGGAVIYANARVISLAKPVITKIALNAGNAEITFSANAGDVVGQFTLQSASVVNGTYLDTSSTITSLGGGAFKAVKLAGASAQYYRIRRIE